MGKKKNKFTTWVKNIISNIDALFAKWFKVDLEPMLYSVIGFSLIASIAISVIAMICQSCDVNENIITAIAIIGAVLMIGYIIKMLLPNVKLIDSIVMKILYVVLNFVAAFIAVMITGYAITAVIMLVVAYFALMLVLGGFGSGDRPDEVTLSDGTKIRKKTGLFSDGDTYEDTSLFSSDEYVTKDGRNFTKK